MEPGCHCKKKTDRYISFDGIDCDGMASRLIASIDRHLAAGHGNAFWTYFNQKRAGNDGSRPDDLFLVHCHINQMRELFEACSDQDALCLLDQVEDECC